MTLACEDEGCPHFEIPHEHRAMPLEEAITLVHHHGWTIHRLGERDHLWDCFIRVDQWTYGFGESPDALQAVQLATEDACHKQIRRVERARTIREKPTPQQSLADLLGDLP